MAGSVFATEPRSSAPAAPWRRLRGLLPLALAGCVPASGAGLPELRQQTLIAKPTIVSVNPCADAILAEVADPAQILAISHYSADPRSSSMAPGEAERFRTIRGTVEEVVALHPDVVIVGSFAGGATTAAYERLGLRVETTGTVSSVGEARAQVRRLAALAGHPKRGEALVARMDAALVAAAPARGAAPIPAVMWESGGMVPGDATVIADLMRLTGFANYTAARGYAQADLLPLERLLADPPRVIFTAAAGEGQGADADRMLDHPALARLDAVARARFAPNLLYCAGPTVIRAARRLAEVRSALSAKVGM